VHQRDVVAELVEGVERPVELHARQAEDGVDPFDLEGLHERLSAGHLCHAHSSFAAAPMRCLAVHNGPAWAFGRIAGEV
jgi:hypothetical protein